MRHSKIPQACTVTYLYKIMPGREDEVCSCVGGDKLHFVVLTLKTKTFAPGSMRIRNIPHYTTRITAFTLAEQGGRIALHTLATAKRTFITPIMGLFVGQIFSTFVKFFWRLTLSILPVRSDN